MTISKNAKTLEIKGFEGDFCDFPLLLYLGGDFGVSYRAVYRPVSPTRLRVGKNRDGSKLRTAEPVTALAESANLDCQKNQPSRFCWLSCVVESEPDERSEEGRTD